MTLSTTQSRTLDESRRMAVETLHDIRQSAANIADTMKTDVLHNTKMLRTVATLLENGLVLLDKDSRITVFNPAASSIFGLQASEAVGKTFGQLFPSLARKFSADSDSIQGIHTLDDEGRSGVVNLSFARMVDSSTDHSFSVLVASKEFRGCQNGECQEGLQQRLKDANDLHSLTIWNFPIPAFFSDAEGTTIRGSKEFYALMGRTPSQLNGRSVEELLPAAYHDWYFKSDDAAPLRMYLTTPQGVREFLAHRNPVTDDTGRKIGYITCLVQQAVQQSGDTDFVRSFIKTIDALDTPLMLVSFAEGRVLLVNRAFCLKYGYERPDIINTKATSILSGGDFTRLRRTMTHALATGKDSLGRFRIRDALGNRIWLTVKAIAISTGLVEGKHPKYCLLTEC